MDSLIVALTAELKDHRLETLFSEHNDVVIYNDLSKIVGPGWVVDRTNKIQLPFRSHITTENIIPNLQELPHLTLLETALDRCRELIKTNKTIYLMWSGGIDSTLALTAFILAGVNSEQLIIVCNNDSIREYPKFYVDHIRGKFKILASELLIQQIKFKTLNGIILSCEQGDCMYGQDFGIMGLMSFGSNYLWEKPTRENILRLFKSKGMTDQSSNCWYDIYSASATESPRAINTVYDFCWWTTFNWRWQWAVEKLRLRFAHDQEISTFFSTPAMQHWSANHTQRHISKLSDFKYDFKKIILDYTNDPEYFENKIKHPSATVYYSINSYIAMNQHRQRISADTFSIKDYYTSNNFISDWLTS